MLKDLVYPEQTATKNYGSFYTSPVDREMNYPVFPCGMMSYQNDRGFIHPNESGRSFAATDIESEIEELKRKGKPYFSFLDKDHVYNLCLNYYQIKD